MATTTQYYVSYGGSNIHVAEIVSGSRVRWDHQNWKYFQTPAEMRAWIGSIGTVATGSGATMAASNFLALPAMTSGSLSGSCIMVQGSFYNLTAAFA